MLDRDLRASGFLFPTIISILSFDASRKIRADVVISCRRVADEWRSCLLQDLRDDHYVSASGSNCQCYSSPDLTFHYSRVHFCPLFFPSASSCFTVLRAKIAAVSASRIL